MQKVRQSAWLFYPHSELLTPPQIVLVCEACIAKAASETGIAPTDEETWAKLIEYMGV